MHNPEPEKVEKMLELYKLPSKTIQEIESRGIAHYDIFNDQLNGVMNHMDICFELYFDICKQLNTKDRYLNSPNHRSIQIVQFVETFYTLSSVYDRVSKGFYTDSISLNRTVLESIFRIYFVGLHPDAGINIWGQLEQQKRQFKFSEVNTEIGIDFSSIYNIMSKHSHGNAFPALKKYVKIDKEYKQGIYKEILPELEYDSLLASLSFNYLYLEFWLLFHFSKNYLIQPNTELGKKILICLEGLSEIIKSMVRENPDNKMYIIIEGIEATLTSKLS